MKNHVAVTSVRCPAWRDPFERRVVSKRAKALTQKRGAPDGDTAEEAHLFGGALTRVQFIALRKHTPDRAPSRRKAHALFAELADAASRADIPRIERALARGANANETHNSLNPILCALDDCGPDVDPSIDLLLGAMNLRRWVRDAYQHGGRSLLHFAAAYRNVNLLRAMLPYCNPRERDEDGGTPLMIALQNSSAGATECALALLPASDANARDPYGRTPLMLAARCGLTECLKSLLPVSDPRATDKEGMTALMHAAQVEGWGPPESRSLECIRALLPLSDTGARDRTGRSAALISATVAKEPWRWKDREAKQARIVASDLIAQHSPREIAHEAFAVAGPEGMPQWAAMLEAEALAAACHSVRDPNCEGRAPGAASLGVPARKRARAL